MPSNIPGILGSVKRNILRNKILSAATILVSIIVFTTASFFIITSLVANRAVQVSETKAQLQVYFQLETPEEEILKVQEALNEQPGVKNLDYITQEEALRLYIDYYSEDEDLTESVSADWLPASIKVQAESLDDLEAVTEYILTESQTNPYIEDVQFHEDTVNQLRWISNATSIGAIVIIVIFSFITVSLIVITIGFNIAAHKEEIEIMHLVGSSDTYIKLPFIIEGTFYTTLGALVAATLLVVPWVMFMEYGVGNNVHFIVTDVLKELSLDFLRVFNWQFILIFYGIHIAIGAVIGFVSSSISVVNNLNLKEK